MILARVIGDVVATVKNESFKGHRILMVQPVDENGDDIKDSFLSCDAVSAGPGDVVLVQQEGNSARAILGKQTDPFHSVICGIVDRVKT